MSSSISSSNYRCWWLWTAGSAMAGFLAMLLLSEYLVRYLVEPNDHFWRSVQIFLKSDSANAALGDSITARGFHGVPGFVNLAIPGESPPLTVAKAETYFRTRQPGKVILSLNPNIFRRGETLNIKRYEDIYIRPREPLLRVTRQRHKERLAEYWKVWLSGNGFVSNVRVPPEGGILVREDAMNHHFEALSAARRRALAVQNVVRDVPPSDLKGGKNFEMLAKLITDLKARGAKVCLVTFPYSKEYREAANSHPQFDSARNYFADFAKQVGVRYSDQWEKFWDPAMFLDPSHLNEVGAKAFSSSVVKDCFETW